MVEELYNTLTEKGREQKENKTIKREKMVEMTAERRRNIKLATTHAHALLQCLPAQWRDRKASLYVHAKRERG